MKTTNNAMDQSTEDNSNATDFPPFRPVKDQEGLPRVLLIGDSISIGYTIPVREALAGKCNVHRPPLNCKETTRGLTEMDSWLGDQHWDLIHFNWGLHDLKHVEGKQNVPPEKYASNLKLLVQRLQRTGAVLIWATTTPFPEKVSPPRMPADVAIYNSIANEIMMQSGVRIHDIHAFVLPRMAELQLPKNVHFTPEGDQALGERVANAILSALKKNYA